MHMPNLFSRLMSKGADKQLKEFRKIADQVNDQEQTFHAMDDEELRSQTARKHDNIERG